jgi:hypothetical protein
MSFQSSFDRARALFCGLALAVLTAAGLLSQAQQPAAPQFGGGYAQLDARRQHLIDGWVTRFTQVTGQKLSAGPFYDDIVAFSSKTTFEAITHALMTTSLTDASGIPLGDALALVERVEAVRGEITGARSDSQFRMYARLTESALDTLKRSKEFKRGADNSVYHKGYPVNYRELGGVPSIQFSVAQDGRRTDIDVDYRSSSFPVSMFNGHLSASNSDVRAGNNYDRHTNRWVGFRNWWQSFFGAPTEGVAKDMTPTAPGALPKTPRAGKKDLDVMAHDFLNAWLVEGNVVAAMGYVSERSYACLAQDSDDPSNFDRGMAPFQIMVNLKAAHEALGPRTSLEGVVVGTRFAKPGLRVVKQPYHAQFVVYSVADDVAAAFDCESRLTLGDPTKVPRVSGNYFATSFNVSGRTDQPVALLWRKENGYWKIVSWQTGVEEREMPAPDAPPVPKAVRIKADASLVEAARTFLEGWLVRKDYDAAFRSFSAKSYACYDLERSPDAPAATSPDDAGQKVRAALQGVGERVGIVRSLDALLEAVEPVHPALRVMDHQYSRTFTLTDVPNAFVEWADCATRARGAPYPETLPLEYGNGFGMIIRFRTKSGDAPVLRLLWVKENDAWRIAVYNVEAS